MRRREFMISIGAGALPWAVRARSHPDADAKRARVSVSFWIFHNLFTTTRDQKGHPSISL